MCEWVFLVPIIIVSITSCKANDQLVYWCCTVTSPSPQDIISPMACLGVLVNDKVRRLCNARRTTPIILKDNIRADTNIVIFLLLFNCGTLQQEVSRRTFIQFNSTLMMNKINKKKQVNSITSKTVNQRAEPSSRQWLHNVQFVA